MSASAILLSRSNKRIIETKYIQNVLQEEAENIEDAQDDVFKDYKDDGYGIIKSSRSFSIANTTLTLRHAISQRFIDMKRLRGRKNKTVPVHNKVIWGHYNNIIFKLAYGYTEDVKKMIAKQYQIEL